MKPGAPGAPGAPGQSMMDNGMPAGPGGPAVSQLSNEIVAPGQGSRSLLDGTQSGPGAPGQSLLDNANASGAPGASMVSGPGGPGQPGQSMLDAGAAGGPGAAPQAAAAAAAGAEAAGQPGASGASGGPGGGPAAKKAEAELVAGAAGGPKAAGELKSDTRGAKAAAELKAGEGGAVPENGASGGPGAKKNAAALAASLGADEDELVDPDADRPNFGTAEDEDSEAEEAAEESEDGFAEVAASRGAGKAAKPVVIRKPMDPAYVTALMMSGIVASIVAVLWFGRAEIAKLLPQFQSLYSRVGVEAPVVGEGLSIAESSKRLQRISGVETLVVRGYISNIGEIPRTVPGIRLELYNEKREVIQAQTAPAPAALLDPGASSEFVIRLELPQLSLAKGGYAVVWDQ